VDADPQGSASICLGINEPDELDYTLANAMLDVINDEEIDYEKLIQFLEIHKQEIRKSELYMQLICRYYEDMEINIIDNREKLLNIIDEDYKKLILTKAKIRVYKNVITEKEVEQIAQENKILENIDDVIWFLYNKIVMNF